MFIRPFLSRAFAKNTRAMSTIVGANGRVLPLPDDMPLMEHDPEIAELLLQEQRRQHRGIELIASENFASRYAMQM